MYTYVYICIYMYLRGGNMTILHSSLHKYIHIVHELHCILRYMYILVKEPARVLYGNYWARGKFEKVM